MSEHKLKPLEPIPSLRELFGDSFTAFTPRMPYYDYEKICEYLGKKPDEDEWLRLWGVDLDDKKEE